ncbi:DUF302 domain-containing protein [Hydrogenimonas urashimensis]|uniref:DUF302 domain-containing protein n=1 Tax=Hydrogenimonas urashimensis TaxID=2740515 RepID=UPI0019167C89|nr:DUF302 domain-containing protein [Hydrogenimonas urashimensis]
MKRVWMVWLILFSIAAAENGVVTYKSRYSVDETTKRLVAIVREKGLTLFKVIDHAEGARRAGKKLRPMKLVIFGNPKMGTPFIQCSETMGLDLPQKMLIYENSAGKTMVAYNAPGYLFGRHNVGSDCARKLQEKMANALKKFAKQAAGVK